MSDLTAAIQQARDLVRLARKTYTPTAVVGLFSGGNDSTTLIDVVKNELDYVCHINTGIGIEQTREFVRQTVADWGIPYIEERTKESYEALILKWGFPGPHGHGLMYQRLKERPLAAVRRRFVTKRGERVVFVSGIRRKESARRFYAGYEPINRQGSIVWVNPIFEWDNDTMMAYRRRYDVPRNPVADLLHMSGECLCGAFAHPGELDEIALWYPDVAKRIRDLEHKAEQAGVPCRWEGRPPPKQIEGQEPMFEFRPLCTACEANQRSVR